MNIIYHKHPGGNFGDDLNTWIWDEIFPSLRQKNNDVHLLGIGTLLQQVRLADYYDKKILMLGTGAGYGAAPPPEVAKSWDIRFVRGPKTCEALEINPNFALCDAAIFLAVLKDPSTFEKTNRPIFIPHVSSVRRHDWSAACASIGVDYVSPQTSSKEVIRAISSAKIVIAESLHAAIIADTFRVPWIPVRISRDFHMYKWDDWSQSLSMNITVPPLFRNIDYIDRCFPIFRYRKWRHNMRERLETSFVSSSIKRALTDGHQHISKSSIISDRLSSIENAFKAVEREYF